MSGEVQNVIQSIEKTYTTLVDERQRVYEEELEKAQQQAMEEYYENIEPDY